MPLITIAGTPISFPDEASSPSWAESVILFAETVATALNSVVGPYDVVSQQMVIDAYNTPSAGAIIPNLAFSPSTVQAAYIKYSVFRNTNTTTVSETGQIVVVYNASNPSSNKWAIARDRVGDALVSFSISDAGQVAFLIDSALTGTSYNGKITFQASALSK